MEVKNKKKGIRKNIDILAKSVQILGELSPSKGAKEGIKSTSESSEAASKGSASKTATGMVANQAPTPHGATGSGGGSG